MSPQRLTAAPTVGLDALSVFNKPVFEAHAELIGLVRQRRGPIAADAFAWPEQEGDHLAWITDLPGAPRRWTDLLPHEQADFDAARLSLGGALGGLVAELMQSGPNTRFGNFGQMLQAGVRTASSLPPISIVASDRTMGRHSAMAKKAANDRCGFVGPITAKGKTLPCTPILQNSFRFRHWLPSFPIPAFSFWISA